MKCENCPLRNKDCICMGENAPILCNDSKYFDILANNCSPPIVQTEYPSLLQQAANFTQTIIDHAKNGFQASSNELYNERMEICNNCDSFDRSQQRCRQCGCFMAAKASIKASQCPLKKWPA